MNFCRRYELPALLALVIITASPSVSAQTDIPLQNRTPTGTLSGTLTLPAAVTRPDVIVIQPGSGPVDRDGNMPGYRNNHLMMLATALAERGIATLRIDKRAIGESRAAGRDESKLRFETYVDDLSSWARLVARRQDMRRLFLAGHSQGALIATLAAQNIKTSGIILLAPPAVPAGRLIARQNDISGAAIPIKNKIREILGALEFGNHYANPPDNLRALFRPSIQPFLISWFRYDPAKELAKLRIAALVVQGTTDLQVWARDTSRLVTNGRNVVQVNVTGMNHILKIGPTDRRRNFATYNMPDLPLAPGLIDVIANFVHR